MTESKPLREWMQSVAWPDNAPDWSPLGKIDCISLEEALSMIACTSSMPITTRRYYKGALDAVLGRLARSTVSADSAAQAFKAYKSGYSLGLAILEQRQNLSIVPEATQSVAYISVAPDDYERMSKRDSQWSEMIEKLRTLSGQVSDLLNQMEKL